jgi:hypothetical protein
MPFLPREGASLIKVIIWNEDEITEKYGIKL